MFKLFQLSALLFLFCFVSHAQISTKKTIGDHAILQRNVEVPVKGWTNPGASVSLSLSGNKLSTTADSDGYWSISIPAMKAGGPHEILIQSGRDVLKYEDIYFGDVWLCSGQSNMEWILRNTNDSKEVIASATDHMIRHFKVPHANEDTPSNAIPGGSWTVGSPETAGDFTAVGYYFAKSLRETNDIPIGLLNSSWGGSRIEPWISKETLDMKHPEYSYSSYVQKRGGDPKEMEEKLRQRYPQLTEKDQGMDGSTPKWIEDKEDDKWTIIDPTRLWEEQGFQNVDGVAYYRTYFEGQEAFSLKLGAIDDNDITWVNGQIVGETNGYNVERVYEVPADILKDGKNELLIRVEDTGGGGGMRTTNFQTNLNGENVEKFEWEIRLGSLKLNTLSNHLPNVIYNAMIHPIIDFPVKGVIWYQGESNAGDLQEAYDYRYLLRTMISEWREKWNQEDLPFYYVQLANWRMPLEQPGNDGWAVIRESMTDVLEVPMTGQAVIIDIGEAGDIHPRNKEDVGYRLALPARNQVYGENVLPGSPMYATHIISGNKVSIEFDQIGEGLMIKDRYGYLKGFSIAGEDKVFKWAKASLEGNKVTVWNESIAKPVAVRYAWEINPGDANLFSKDGLPVNPFRTDDFDVTKE